MWLSVASCNAVRHLKIKKIAAASSSRCRVGQGGDFTNFAPYLNRLIEGYGARYQPQVKVGVTSANAEPLSTREGEILRMTAERSACTCQLSEVWVRCLAMMQLHSASRKAPPFNPNHLRGAACDAVFVLVLAKARFRLARAKPKRHNGHG